MRFAGWGQMTHAAQTRNAPLRAASFLRRRIVNRPMRAQLGALLALCAALQALAGTGITVTNNYKKEVNGEMLRLRSTSMTAMPSHWTAA